MVPAVVKAGGACSCRLSGWLASAQVFGVPGGGGFVGAGLVEINCRWFRAGANLACPFCASTLYIRFRVFVEGYLLSRKQARQGLCRGVASRQRAKTETTG